MGVRATREQSRENRPLEDLVDEFFSGSGPLASLKRGYEPRPQQLGFARAVAAALAPPGEEAGASRVKGNDDEDAPPSVLLADGPTGTGKSLAYLVPAILSGKRVVVSTATINLQHQLLNHELPLLSAALSAFTGGRRSLSFALLKGRGNFLCEKRFEEALARGAPLLLGGGGNPSHGENLLEDLNGWRRNTPTGDREELSYRVPFWPDIAADADDCVPQRCAFAERCFSLGARRAAEGAEVLVVNHAMLLTNISAAGQVFDMEGRILIADEAHRLEESMADAFGRHVTRNRARYVTATVEKKAPNIVRFTSRVEDAADLFFDELRAHTALGRLEDAPPSYDRLQDALLALRHVVASNPSEEVNKLSRMIARLHGDLRSFYEPPEDTHAYAVLPPKRAGRFPQLKSWLVDTGLVSAREVIARESGATTILASATLAEGSGRARSFGYVRRRLGVDLLPGGSSVAEFGSGETFDYRNNCLIYLERDLETPNVAAGDGGGGPSAPAALLTERSVRRTEQLLEASRGRALVLLSTYRALEQFRRSLKTPYPTRYQGDASPSRLVAWLKETEGAVLIGTRTFWEGVDVPGDALSLVVLDRCPFPPPDDPVIEALTRKAGAAWFREVSLPKARVAIRQGSGRLIRTRTDHGVIALLDPRVTKKGWGRAIVRSMPPAPVTSSPEDVSRFFAR